MRHSLSGDCRLRELNILPDRGPVIPTHRRGGGPASSTSRRRASPLPPSAAGNARSPDATRTLFINSVLDAQQDCFDQMCATPGSKKTERDVPLKRRVLRQQPLARDVHVTENSLC